MNLTQKIQGLTAQANNTTGKSDTTLSDAVESLIDGFGPNIDVQPLNVIENGTYAESGKAFSPVIVDVPNPSTGTLTITENGTYDVTDTAEAAVNVQPPLEQKSVTPTKQTQTVEPTAPNYGLSRVTVDPIPSEYIIPSGTQSIVQNGQYDITEKAAVDVQVPNTYTQADEGKVVDNGALVAQTSRTVSDNGTYDTTLNNEVVVNNTDYSEALVAFGVEDDLADGIEALTTYANEVTGESDTTLSDAVRTLAEGYGGGSADVFTGTFVGNGTTEITISAPFDPDIVIAYSPNKLTDIAGNATWYYFYGPMVSMSPRRTTSGWGDSASVINLPASNNRPGKTYADGALTLYANGSSIYQFARGARYIFVLARFSVEPRLPEAYQEVSCLVCDGGQYIDTGFRPNTTKTKVEIGIIATSNDVIQGLCGARNGTAFEVDSCNIFKMNGNLRFDWVDASATKMVAANLNTYFDVSCTRGRAEVNTTVVTASVTDSADVNHTFYVGNINSAGSPYANGFIGSIFYTRLYDEGTLVRDLVPCYRKADDKPGMYDLVHDVFYTNDGTGDFSKGNDI